jgi:hypothetical protein
MQRSAAVAAIMSPIQFGQRMRIRSAGYRSGKTGAPTKMRGANQNYHIPAAVATSGRLLGKTAAQLNATATL